MAKWKIFIIWFALICYRVGTAILLVHQSNENELVRRDNMYFWLSYVVVWLMCLTWPDGEGGLFEVLYGFVWSFLIGITGLGIKVLSWVLIREMFGVTVRYFWGEVFTVIFATLCLAIPFKLKQSSKKLQENL